MFWVRAAGLPPCSGSGSDSWCRRDGSTETRVLEVNRLKFTPTADHMITWYQSAVHQQEVKSSVHCHAQHEFRELWYICPTVCLCLWIPLNSSVDSCSSCRCFSSLLHFINVRLSNWDTLEPQTCRSAGLVKITSAIREEIAQLPLCQQTVVLRFLTSFLFSTCWVSQSSLLEVLRTSLTEAMWSWCCAVQIKLISFNTEEKSSSY